MNTIGFPANKPLWSQILSFIGSDDQSIPRDDHIFAFPDLRCFDMVDDFFIGINDYTETSDFIDQQRKYNLGNDFYLEHAHES